MMVPRISVLLLLLLLTVSLQLKRIFKKDLVKKAESLETQGEILHHPLVGRGGVWAGGTLDRYPGPVPWTGALVL